MNKRQKKKMEKLEDELYEYGCSLKDYGDKNISIRKNLRIHRRNEKLFMRSKDYEKWLQDLEDEEIWRQTHSSFYF